MSGPSLRGGDMPTSPNAENAIWHNVSGGIWVVTFGITWDADVETNWTSNVVDYGDAWVGTFGTDNTVRPSMTRAAEGQMRINLGPAFNGYLGHGGGIRSGTYGQNMTLIYLTSSFTGPTNNYVTIGHRHTTSGNILDPDSSVARYVLFLKYSGTDGGEIAG